MYLERSKKRAPKGIFIYLIHDLYVVNLSSLESKGKKKLHNCVCTSSPGSFRVLVKNTQLKTQSCKLQWCKPHLIIAEAGNTPKSDLKNVAHALLNLKKKKDETYSIMLILTCVCSLGLVCTSSFFDDILISTHCGQNRLGLQNNLRGIHCAIQHERLLQYQSILLNEPEERSLAKGQKSPCSIHLQGPCHLSLKSPVASRAC